MTAQSGIEQVMACLMAQAGGSDALIAAQSQHQVILALKSQLASANPSDLPALQAQIASVIAEASSTIETARSGSTGAVAREVALTTAQLRSSIRDVMGGMKDFDPYLQFGSAEEEEAYREREQARQAYIEAELAKGTPEGDYNAAAATRAQLLDAQTYGAGDHPDFDERMASLNNALRQTKRIAAEAGVSTSEGDAILRGEEPYLHQSAPRRGVAADIEEHEFASIAAAFAAAGVEVPDVDLANGHGVDEALRQQDAASRSV